MRNFLALIIVSIYAVDFANGCWSRPTAPLPPEFFLIDSETPVYLHGRDSNDRRSLQSMHEETHIKHMKFHKNNRDIKPYTLFLKTIVIVDYSMYQKLNIKVLDNVMACMFHTENQVNKKYEFPHLKIIVTAIIIPTDNEVLSSFTPDSNTYLNTSPTLFEKMREFLSKLKIYETGMNYEFAIFISSAKSVYNEDINQLRKVTSNGFPSCRKRKSPGTQSVIAVVDQIPDSDYSTVYGELLKIIEHVSEHMVCERNFIKYNEQFVTDVHFQACTNENLKDDFKSIFRKCFYETPKFLKD
uniref:Uncharacterized protein n=1 Tax=Cotesia flavipes TaxID=89805 RepID=A0A8K1YTP1_COTFL|nr:hypothetical protein [Cotesia flavipes]